MAVLSSQTRNPIIGGVLLIAALVMAQFPAHAMTAGELYRSCTSTDSNSGRGVYCSAFFIGYARGLYFAAESPKHGMPPLCVPGNASPNTLRSIFEKQARDHPEDMNREDRFVVDLAAAAAFACKEK